MAKEPDNIVLEHLRVIRGILDQHTQEFADIKLRLSSMDQHMAGFQLSEVRQNSELDRLRERLTRIERRPELADGE